MKSYTVKLGACLTANIIFIH